MSCARNSRARIGACLILAASAAAAQDCPAPPATGPEGFAELLLAVDNGPGGSEALQSVLHDGRFWLDGQTLAGWRVPPPALAPRRHAGQDWWPLDAIAGLAHHYDGCAQALHVDLSRVQREVLQYSLRAAPPLAAAPSASPGAFANLDLQASRDHGVDSIAAIGELGSFGAHGRALQTFLVGNGRRVRLDSTWLREDPERLRTLALGDSVSSGGSWGRPLRYGGLRWGTDFRLQPQFVSFPQPALRGDAALPSTLDVFVNDSLRGRQQVDGGAFLIEDVPTLTGGGEARIVVRDLLGRETVLTRPFYVSPALLRDGLAAYSVDLGWERGGYGIASADYGSAFGVVNHRLGISDTLSRELRVELAHDALAAGVSAQWLPRQLGLFSGTLAWGGDGLAGGALASLGLERQIAGRYSVSLRSQWAEPGFWQLGLDGEAAPRLALFGSIGARLPWGASLSIALASEDRRAGADRRLASASYQQQFARGLHLGLAATSVSADTRSDSLLATLSFALAERLHASLQQEWDGSIQATQFGLQRSARSPLDWGARAELRSGNARRATLLAEYGTAEAQYTAALARDAAGSSARVGLRSSLLFLDRTGYITRPMTGSFALVQVGGLPGVPVYVDNRIAGHTGSDGKVLLPDLRPWERNIVSVRARDLPIEQELATLTREVVPRDRSGVSLSLGEEDVVGMELVLQNESGARVPAGAEVRELATAQAFPVGSGGRVFVRQRVGIHHLWVRAPGWDCIARIELRAPVAGASLPIALCRKER